MTRLPHDDEITATMRFICDRLYQAYDLATEYLTDRENLKTVLAPITELHEWSGWARFGIGDHGGPFLVGDEFELKGWSWRLLRAASDLGLFPPEDPHRRPRFVPDAELESLRNRALALQPIVDGAAPSLIMYRRELRIYAAGIDAGMFLPANEVLQEFETDDKVEPGKGEPGSAGDEAEQRRKAAELREKQAELVRLLESREVLPERFESDESVLALGMQKRSIRNAGQRVDNNESPGVQDVQDALSTSTWIGTGRAVRNFIYRLEAHDDADWSRTLEATVDKFKSTYDFCHCESKTHATDQPGAPRRQLRGAIKEVEWLFDGAPQYLTDLAHTELMRKRNLRDDGSMDDERKHIFESRGFYFDGIDALTSRGERSNARVVEALSNVWKAAEESVPPSLHHALFARPPEWNTRRVSDLLEESAANLVDIQRDTALPDPPT